MIKIGKIDDKLSIFYGKQTVIWGTGVNSLKIYRYLRYFNVNVTMFCDNDCSKWQGLYLNKPIISPEKLLEMYSRESIVVAIGCDFDKEISKQLDDMGITDYVLYGEMLTRFKVLSVREKINNCVIYDKANSRDSIVKRRAYEYIANNPDNDYLLLCLPQKTGDTTLEFTLNSIHYDFCNFMHIPRLYKTFCNMLGDKISDSQIKIITAVREPIGQNLSMMYQHIGVGFNEYVTWNINDKAYYENGGDAQKMFDERSKEYLNSSFPFYYENKIYGMIQNFIPMMGDIGFNLLDKEFDKNRGYSIYKFGNIELFVYQLEKLNVVWKELCKWLKINSAALINGNIGDKKWYAKSYAQAQKELKISQEYFDKCYNEPYVKHFYSDEDIAKFKDKWRGHIV